MKKSLVSICNQRFVLLATLVLTILAHGTGTQGDSGQVLETGSHTATWTSAVLDFAASYDKLSITNALLTGGQATVTSQLAPHLTKLSLGSQVVGYALDLTGSAVRGDTGVAPFATSSMTLAMGFCPLFSPGLVFHSGHELLWKWVDPSGYERFYSGIQQEAQRITGSYTQTWRAARELMDEGASVGTAPPPDKRSTNSDLAECKNNITRYQKLQSEIQEARERAVEYKGYRMWDKCKEYRSIHDKKVQEIQALWQRIQNCPGRPSEYGSFAPDCSGYEEAKQNYENCRKRCDERYPLLQAATWEQRERCIDDCIAQYEAHQKKHGW
ncbi:MAG: hypothetical protein V1792_03845 [Pseudomonadota bacterium]